MPHHTTCQNCGKPVSGNINIRFCSDACRKYFKRHGEVSRAIPKAHQLPDQSGQDRTTPRSGGSSLVNYAAKKGIDLLTKYAENTLIPAKTASKTPINAPNNHNNQPLVAQTADDIINNPLNEIFRAEVDLPADWQDFLGAISYPFKMLVWGLPGSGKSSFCMQLANHIGRIHKLIYVAGEEELNSQTMIDKQSRLITDLAARKNCVFLPRLPLDAAEWQQVMPRTLALSHNALFYDSVTQLGISPFYVQAATSEYNLPLLPGMGHIFITHAHKDGQAYRGDGSWAHEVDVVVRVEKGLATTEKNRFGEVGRTLKVY